MNLFNVLSSPKPKILRLYLDYFLFVINDHFIKSKMIAEKLWQSLKLNILYIDGHCLKDGVCCRGIMLYKNQKPLDTLQKFQKVCQKQKEYLRFIPIFDLENFSKITKYTCNYLTSDNTCKDYENRPNFCRQYPFSNFLVQGHIYSSCGYKIKQKSIPLDIKNKTLRAKINNLLNT